MIARIYRILLAGFCISLADLAIDLAPRMSVREAGAAPLAAAQADPGPRLTALDAPARLVGAGSCAAAACHGGEIGAGPKGSEYQIWIQRDPHAMAYTMLFSKKSQAIVGKLGLKGGAHCAPMCLKCHSLAAAAAEYAPGRPSVLADGVSCEACHGAAEHWLEPHKRYNLPANQQHLDWRRFSSKQKSAQGFNDTKSVLARTQACVRCHVGEPGRDVDHDLIAAGHPRLYFEMSTYLAKIPAHWEWAADRKRHPGLETKLWVVGQLASADAALRLLEYRATGKPDGVWPEFAEYACFSCHHDLAASSGRQDFAASANPGLLQWGTWNFAMVKELARLPDAAGPAQGLPDELERLAGLMARPANSRDEVVESALGLRNGLQSWAEDADGKRYGPEELQNLISVLLSDIAHPATRDWESSTQLYLALMAVARTDRDGAANGRVPLDPKVCSELQGICDLLRFPSAQGKMLFLSPGDFNEARIDELSKKLQRLPELMKTK